MALGNRAVEHNVAMFSELSLAIHWRGRLSRDYIVRWVTANIKLLTSAAMVDNLAEKVDECPLNRGRHVLFVYNWEPENSRGFQNCPLYQGCSFSGVSLQ